MYVRAFIKSAILSLTLICTSCGGDGVESKVSIKITPDVPTVINANTSRSVVTIDEEGGSTVENIEVPGPYMYIGFDLANNNDRVITILALTLLITGPDNNTRTANVFNFDNTGAARNIFATLRPEKDVDCNGLVDDAEKELENPTLTSGCEFDSINPSFNGRRALIEDILNGVEDIDQFRNATYQVIARFQGIVGLVTDSDTENFFKEITFTASTN